MTGQEFRSMRRSLGLTQCRLALKLGVTQYHVSDLERGRKPIPNEIEAKMGRMISPMTQRPQRASDRICGACMCVVLPSVPCGCLA